METKGKVDFLELFSDCARMTKAMSLTGLTVAAPVDLKTGFDLLTKEGQTKCMEVIKRQCPTVIFLAPVCTAWSQWNNLRDPAEVTAVRRKMMPMISFSDAATRHQIGMGRYFLREKPSGFCPVEPARVSRTLSTSSSHVEHL